MKKHLLYTLLFSLTVLSACKKQTVNPAPGERPEERVAAALDGYSASLTGNTNGWKAFLFPAGGGVYLFSMKFSTANRVTMLSDINTTTAGTSLESSYRLRSQNVPSLLFDTYSYIHLLTDPDPNANGGVAGNGYLSDFEFAFEKTSAAGDTITLMGNRLASTLILVKAASATDFDSFTKGTNDVLSKFSQLRTYWKRITIGGTECEVKLNPTAKTMTFSYLVNGNYVSATGQFYVDGSTSTIVFLTPVTIGTTKITDIKSFALDAVNHTITGTINGASVQFREAIAPLKNDLGAAQRWYTQTNINFNSTWVSDKAFHYGVDDFCNFKSVPGYSTLWYAGSGFFGGTSEGMIAFVSNALSSPYTLSRPFTVNAGLGRFTLNTNSGTFTDGTPKANAMNAARQILYGGATINSSQDWYFIQTNAAGTAYDMVRATDAQAWISWRPR
jgi:hypothetical protein